MKGMNYLKKVVAMLASAAMMLTSAGLPYTQVVYAEPSDSQSEAATLSPVTDLQWVEGSSATVSWTASEGANYYAVTVTVYEPNGATLLGSTNTGTTATELDVQQEIHDVIGEAEYDFVKVTATVVAQKKQDDVVVVESEGVSTGLLEYSTTKFYRHLQM